MAGKPWSEDEDRILRDFNSQLTVKEISALLPGRTERAIHHRREALGLPAKSPQAVGQAATENWVRELEARLGESAATWLERRYVQEQASYREITAELGINTRSLMKLLKRSGIKPITPDKALARQLERNPDFLESFKRSGGSYEAACKRAQSRQENWSGFCTSGELEFLNALQQAGLSPVPQLAVESFNIDFAFLPRMLAVEYDPRWHNSPRKRPMDRKKDRRLEELGWTVLRLDTRTSNAFNVAKVSEALTSLASTHPR